MATLEELDSNKKGMSEVARNARQASRFLDAIVSKAVQDISAGIPLENAGAKEATGRLFLQTEAIDGELPARLAAGKADNQVIGVVKHLQEGHDKREVILVSKDINMRIKARALGLAAEDYFNDKVLEDTDLLYTGVQAPCLLGPARKWNLAAGRPPSIACAGLCAAMVNGFICKTDKPFYQAKEKRQTAILPTIRDYPQKNNV
jgi:PhoH-like ATPase